MRWARRARGDPVFQRSIGRADGSHGTLESAVAGGDQDLYEGGDAAGKRQCTAAAARGIWQPMRSNFSISVVDGGRRDRHRALLFLA